MAVFIYSAAPARQCARGSWKITTRLIGTLLRCSYEVRDEKKDFDKIQDMKVNQGHARPGQTIVTSKTADRLAKFEGRYEKAPTQLRNGKTVKPKPPQKGENVVGLMDALE